MHVIEVELAHDQMVLVDADETGLAAGANLAMVGGELLQFGRAAPIGGNRWRLSELWRGRRGTEAVAGTQTPGERFVLLSHDTIATIDLPAAALGVTVKLLARGAGDTGTAEAQAEIAGASVLPLAPAQLRLIVAANGEARAHWARRSRNGWEWIDGVDVPLGEEVERYRVLISAGTEVRSADLDTPEILLTAAERAEGATIEVRQVGARGLSPAATLIVPPLGES
jgi:hypothetical protein